MKVLNFRRLVSLAIATTMLLTAGISSFATSSPETSTLSPQEMQSFKTNAKVEKIDDSNFKITKVTNNEYSFSSNNVNATFKKDSKNVTYKYYVGKELVLTNTKSLKEADQIGLKLKAESLNAAQSDAKVAPQAAALWPVGDYAYDNILYAPKSQYVPYAHPEKAKSVYNISPYSTWSIQGTTCKHIQINYYNSQSILGTPSWAIGGAIGAAIGFYCKSVSVTVIGTLIGVAIGAIGGGQVLRLADENGCIWVVICNKPKSVNLGSWWYPMIYDVYSHIGVGPYIKDNIKIAVSSGY